MVQHEPHRAPFAEEDIDLRHINPPLPKVGAGFTLLAGVLGILSAIQTLLSVRIHSSWAVAPYLLATIGGALVFLARSLFTARRWAAVGAVGAGSALGLTSTAWLIFAVTHGFLALYTLWTPPGALLAIALAASSIPACDRATRARERLTAQGMNLGL